MELNFRDEKTVMGVGEAQVRTKAAVEAVPAFVVAAYAFLLLAGTERNKEEEEPVLPLPKWREAEIPARQTTAKMIGMLRSQLWGTAMGMNLTDFVTKKASNTKSVLSKMSLQSAVCYAFR